MTQDAGTAALDGRTGARLRRQRFGWYAYGWASHTFEVSVISVFMSRYLPATARAAVGEQGRLHVLGIPIAPSSLFAYTVSFCAILLVFVMPVVGAIADRSGRKRELLLGFGFAGALGTAAMVFVGPNDWQLGTGLLVFAYVTYTCGKVVFNSILPDLAAADERDRVSSVGWAYAFLGGGIVLAASFVGSFVISDSGLLARLALCLAGLWWAAFALIPVRALRGLPRVSRRDTGGSVVTAGFRELGTAIRGLKAFPITLLFLVAYLIYYDGITTVTTMAADFGQEELKLPETTLLTAILIVQFAAFGGALLLGKLAERFGAKRVVCYSLIVWIGVVVAAYFMQAHSPAQFFALAIALSVVMAGSQALSRSLYASMIPAGSEAKYFSLYEISSSGSSALGPLLFGLALQNTGSYRVAIFSLIFFFVLGLVLLIPVNVRKAIRAAGNTPPASL
ncbi:MFS transporter [Sciscionella sediminilitoris]|uniref:MFS transporter n=1 Tax=Sciscionella sediminilitoris TaxID=1445613 RepID=UPI0004DF5EB3|nr:MFS transporter [Sciscionella sp. SE31]